MDIFAELTTLLQEANDSYLETTANLMGAIERFYDPNITIPDISRNLFCILDEAQVAVEEGLSSFRGKDISVKRPFLREIVSFWSQMQNLNIIVAGTGLSLTDVQQTLESGDLKLERFRTWHDTGSFRDSSLQRRYLELYLPNAFLHSERGKRLSTRVYNWLRGRCARFFFPIIDLYEDLACLRRHRFTASFVQMLLQVGIASPHRLLNQYIADSTGVTPTDGNGDIEAERPILEATTPSFKPLDFSKLGNGEPSKLPRSIVLLSP